MMSVEFLFSALPSASALRAVSQRALKEVFEITPALYLRCLRLNETRRNSKESVGGWGAVWYRSALDDLSPPWEFCLDTQTLLALLLKQAVVSNFASGPLQMKSYPDRKTKIVATLGPASSSRETIRKMIQCGLNAARFNFSHGTHESHSAVLQTLREEALDLGANVAVFQDLCGPKVRIGDIENGQAILSPGQPVRLKHRSSQEISSAEVLYVEAFDPAAVMKPGEKVFLADGRIELIAEKVSDGSVLCEVLAGGPLRSRSGIAVPDSALNLPCLTAKDIEDVSWAVENKIDYIALSFTGTARDVFTLRNVIQKSRGSIPIIAKIERALSMNHLDEIVQAADAVMVARGDLGLELPLAKVPGAQRAIIQNANFHGTPVITATQMLQSMVKEVRPTRAEVSDVWTAVRDGTDAVMLSEETAIGDHPAEAVQMLSRICTEAETELAEAGNRTGFRSSDRETVADAVCYAACGAADKIEAAAIIACTHSGYTARLMAKYRPAQPLFSATSNRAVMSRLALTWGVEPLFVDIDPSAPTEQEITCAMAAVRDAYGLKPGARVVITAGLRSGRPGSTNLMEIREIQRC